MAKKDIVYVEHPITAEQKKGYTDKGLKIIDARFAPEGAKVVKREIKEDGPNEGTVPWLKMKLDEKEVEYADDALKVDLEKLLNDSE